MVKRMTSIDLFKSSTTQFKYLISKLISLPLWVKQAIYCELKADLKECSDVDLLDKVERRIIQLYIPKLTSLSHKLSKNIDKTSSLNSLEPAAITFIDSVNEELNLLEIAHHNQWSLKTTCIVLLELIDKGFVEPFDSPATLNFIHYIAGRIRLGEFLVRTNRLTSMQLDKALYSKKCAESLGTEVSFKDIIINLGYLTHKEITNITSIKESSEKIVLTIDEGCSLSEQIIMLQDEVDALQFQNKKLELELQEMRKALDERQHENLELLKQNEKYSKGFMNRIISNLS